MIEKNESLINRIVLKRYLVSLGAFLLALLRFLKWPTTILLSILLINNFNKSFFMHLDYKMLLAYIAVLRWPVVALIAIFFIKPYLPKLIDRLIEFGVAGSKATFAPPHNQTANEEANALKKADPKAGEDKDAGIDEDESQKLERILSSADAYWAYEQVYRDIYGTQLEVVKRLSTYTAGLKAQDLNDLLLQHQRLAPTPYPNMVAFMQYLLANIVVVYEPEKEIYQLTNAGSFFLAYLSKYNLLDRYKAF